MAEDSAKIVIGADVSGALGGIQQLIGAMPGLGTAIAGGFSIAAVTAFTQAAIDAADELNDLSQKIGVSVETLAGFKLIAEQNGTTVEAMGGAIKKLSTYMVENEQKLASVGVTAKTADGALLQLSDIFARMPDGVQKTALATELFGKAGMDMIPMLNQGSSALNEMLEKGKELNPITAEMAKQADKFNDNLLELKMNATAAGTALVADMLPALNSIVERMLAGTTASKSFVGGLKELATATLSEEGIKTRIANIKANQAAGNGYETDDADIARYERELNRIRAAKAEQIVAATGPVDSREGKAYLDSQQMAAKGAATKILAKKDGKEKKKKEKWDGPGFDSATQDTASDIADVLKSNEAYERDIARAAEAEEKKTEAYKQGLAQRWEAMVIDNMSKDELELARYEEKMAALEVMRANELISEQMFEEQRAQIQIAAAQKASSAQLQIAAAQASWEKMTAQQKTQFMLSQAMALTAGFATQSKTAFEINKKLSIAQATMTTYDNAVKAFNAYASIPYVGPILGAVAAAGAIAFGMAQVSQIKSQQFGGGGAGGAGSIPSMPSYSPGKANAQMLEGDTMPGQAQPVAVMGKAETARTQVSVTLVGSAFDYNTVATELIPLLNDAAANGAEIVVQRG